MESSIDPVAWATKKLPSSGIVYIVGIVIILVVLGLFYSNQNNSPKPTLEDKLTQLKTLRAHKSQKQKEIFLIDQKIIPLKCSIYSDVWAKDQWNLECQDYFNDQQSKMKEAAVIPASTPAEASVSETFDE